MIEMSRWWLFLGFVFLCSGFLMPIGALIVAWYIMDFLSKKKRTDLGLKIDDYSKETMEQMR